ncbi:hypothetical protein [Streptomyces caniscabiei]|uniref:hypothetical protein n=1 Tax=Streptomyces caniscabiei TaxID=2746961 RepID=UPI0038F68FA1
MTVSANRLIGAATMLAGICVCLWLALGVPQEWTGGMRWLRTALALASLGAISLGVRFVYPDRDTDTPGEAPDGEGADTRV